ncbi:MAG: D-tyrosyl-tRNA(Tyr) deacylase [Firmicutes bacterium]|nr:D-tyrosyl-tRNA(Tyr) deacylase [Bacillota bacterium]
MRALIQRVSFARVAVGEETTGEIGQGLLIFLGVKTGDEEAALAYLVEKIINLRIFSDEQGKMNLSLLDVGGEVMVVSQFTLYADCRKGRRPSFQGAAPPAESERLYEQFIQALRDQGLKVATGRFGADMQVTLVNDGPVTIFLDTDELRG